MWRAKTAARRGHCKRHDTHSCQTERGDEIAVLATVSLADRTGEIAKILVDEGILVDEENICDLAGVSTKDQLLTLLGKRGPYGICFKHLVDVRPATNTRKASAARSNVPAAL